MNRTDTIGAARWQWLLLACVMVAAVSLRFWGIGFCLPFSECRPDESRIINLASRIAQGDLNPHYFVYPTLYMYLLAGLFHVQAVFTGAGNVGALERTDLFLAARCLTATFGSITVLAVYGLARRLADELTALIAAALLAFAFLHVRDSHFGTTDVPMTFGIVLALLVLLNSESSRSRIAAAGVLAGLATALKYNAALVLTAAIFLETFRVLTREQRPREGLVRLSLFALAALGGFISGTPFALADMATFASDLQFVGSHQATGHVHAGRVITESHAGWRYATVILPAAMGWPAYAGGVIGMGLLGWRDRKLGIAASVFPVLYFVTISRGATVFARYVVPLIPFLCIGAAYLVRWAAQRLAGRAATAVVAVTVALFLWTPVSSVIRVDLLLTRPDNRALVSVWFDEYVSAGSSLWQSGSSYGKVQFLPPSRYDEWTFDDERGSFRRRGQETAELPDYILMQRSPLTLYSATSERILRLVETKYALLRSFKTGAASLTEGDYDPFDAFFLPLTALSRVHRAGPEFDVYQRHAQYE